MHSRSRLSPLSHNHARKGHDKTHLEGQHALLSSTAVVPARLLSASRDVQRTPHNHQMQPWVTEKMLLLQLMEQGTNHLGLKGLAGSLHLRVQDGGWGGMCSSTDVVAPGMLAAPSAATMHALLWGAAARLLLRGLRCPHLQSPRPPNINPASRRLL